MTADKTALLRLRDAGTDARHCRAPEMISGEVLGGPALQLHTQQPTPE
jgi:hypothetical protein